MAPAFASNMVSTIGTKLGPYSINFLLFPSLISSLKACLSKPSSDITSFRKLLLFWGFLSCLLYVLLV